MAPELVLLAVGLTLWIVGMFTAPSEHDIQSKTIRNRSELDQAR
jgi:hypothetical protein